MRRIRVLTAAVLGLGVLGAFVGPSSFAATVVPGGTFQTITNGQLVHGDIITAGNGLLTCGAACPVHSGSQANNGYTMTYADTDSDATTFDSTTASLTIPAGATVAKAWLMWDASFAERINGVNAGCLGGSARATVNASFASVQAASPLLKIDTGAYQNVGQADYLSYATPVATRGLVNGAVDVTSELSALSSGTHAITVADLPSAQGPGCEAGWSLHVTYDYGSFQAGNTDSSLRKIYTSFGFAQIDASNPSDTVTFSGFRTVGPGARLVLTASDGEPVSGDTATVAWNGGSQALSNPLGSSTNLFVGKADGAKSFANPTDANFFTGSIDTWRTTAANVPTGTTSLDFSFNTSGDGFFPEAVSLAVPVAQLQIKKTAADGTTDGQIVSSPGGTPTFNIVATNSSGVIISNAQVTDTRAVSCTRNGAPVTLSGGAFQIGDLAAGASATLVCLGPTAQVGDANYTNTATLTGTDPNGDSVGPVSDTSDVQISHLTLTKTVDRATVPSGTQVTWTIRVLNDGHTSLRTVRIDDADCTGTVQGPTGPGSAGGVLAAGDTWTYTCSEAVTADKTNHASVTATPTGSVGGTAIQGSDLTATAQADVDVTTSIELNKRVARIVDVNGNGLTDAGDEIHYEFDVTNDTATTLTNPSISDPLVGAVTCPTSIGPNATVTCTADHAYVITAADAQAGVVNNTATASATDVSGANVNSNQDSTSTPVQVTRSSLRLNKRVARIIDANHDGITDAGDKIRYEFDLTNTGQLVLSNPSVSDPLIGRVTCPTRIGLGRTVTCRAANLYTITAADARAGRVKNTATASATDSSGHSVRSRPDSTLTRVRKGSTPTELPDTGA
jgi:hypothetical protein